MGSRAIDITGQRFGSLVAIKRLDKKNTNGGFIWLFKCDCGAELEKSTGTLIHKGRTSDKCEKCPRETLRQDNDGKDKRTYRIYSKMLNRAFHKYEEYKHVYKGVEVCERWTGKFGFEHFLEDMGECPSPKHSLNRVACANLYSKETCEWTTSTVQTFERKLLKSNKCGVTGVRWRVEKQVWEARIKQTRPKIIYYGDSFKEAVETRIAAEILEYGFSKTVDEWVVHGVPVILYRNGLSLQDVVLISEDVLREGCYKINNQRLENFIQKLKQEVIYETK